MYLLLGSAVLTQALRHLNVSPCSSFLATFSLLYASALTCYYVVWHMFLWPRLFSPLKSVPGPQGHWFFGNFREIYREKIGVPHLGWQKQFPNQPLIRYAGLFNVERLLVTSQAALQHVLVNCYDYPKPVNISEALKNILGANGILFVEGDVHKRQRKQMNPSFSYTNIKSMMPIFWSKAQGLVEAWSQLCERNNEIEVLAGLSSATLDIIGSAGFGYDFNAIQSLTNPELENKLAIAYADLFNTKSKLLGFLVFIFPIIRKIPFQRHLELDRDIAMIKEMSTQIVDGKVAVHNSGGDIGNDIFALLLKDNQRKAMEMDPSSPPMSNGEIGDQTTTLLAAGHETTSAGTTWALHALSMHQSIQDRLRAELTEVISSEEEPSFEKIESLHYLNNVTKEVLRLYPPVPMTRRIAMVSGPIDGVFVPKGTELFIAPICINQNPAIWGRDAADFNPDRWDNLPSTHNNYGMETFLHGARGCIGQRFAMVEMKSLLAALLLTFKFEPKPGHVVEPISSITMRPKHGLPLILTKV